VAFDADNLGLQRGAIVLVRDLVHERTGLFYEDARVDAMADRLASLVTARGFDSFLDYYYLLKYDEAGAEEWERVMDALSVPETYFWREVDQLRAVVDHIVPGLAVRATARPIRIWCVPCASGEEPLTLAMMLDMAGWFSRVPIEIRASDASQAMVDTARRGLFRERAFRSLPKEIMARYFTRDGERWRIDPAIHARVLSWTRVNLLATDEVMPLAAVDIIFCRNVFIYFSEAAVRRVAHAFADRMCTPGYLCIGASESLLRITDRFDLERIGEAFVYVKRAAPVEGRR
jgi:chemotaxis protein methyltransferase CheR